MTTRRLAAILAADVVGFSSIMESDEEGTLARLKCVEREVIQSKVTRAQWARGEDDGRWLPGRIRQSGRSFALRALYPGRSGGS